MDGATTLQQAIARLAGRFDPDTMDGLLLMVRAAQVDSEVGQGDFLRALGIDGRAATLAAKGGEDVIVARNRLVNDGEMGDLFGVVAITAPGWPTPAVTREAPLAARLITGCSPWRSAASGARIT